MAKSATKRTKTKTCPPAPDATTYCSCCAVGREIYHYGGSCGPDSCFHDSLFKLNVDSLAWKPVLATGDDHPGPMKKHGCGMFPFRDEGKVYLLTIGGAGETTSSRYHTSRYAQYVSSHQKPQLCYTDELWSICVSAPPGLFLKKTKKKIVVDTLCILKYNAVAIDPVTGPFTIYIDLNPTPNHKLYTAKY